MGAKDIVRVSGKNVERKVLNNMAAELGDYHRNRGRIKYLQAKLPEIPHESSSPADGMPRGSDVSNPTLAKVEKMSDILEEINELRAWFVAVEAVREALSGAQAEIMDHLYFLPRREREFTMVGIAKNLSMSESEAWRTKDEAVLEFMLVLHPDWIGLGWEDSGGNRGGFREAR